MGVTPSAQKQKTPAWMRYAAMAVGLVVGTLTFRMVPDEIAMGVTVGAVGGGTVGLLPYFTGRKRNRKLAIGAIWICIVCGALAGQILALPTAVALCAVLWFGFQPAQPSQTTP